MEKKRSKGVTALAIFLSLYILPACVIGFYAGITGLSGNSPYNNLSFKAGRLLYMLSPLIFLISAIGIFMLKAWGRILTLVLSVGILLFSVYGVFDAFKALALNQFSIILFFIILVTFSSAIYYLTRPKVKEQFR